jgi:hypothetical protein
MSTTNVLTNVNIFLLFETNNEKLLIGMLKKNKNIWQIK